MNANSLQLHRVMVEGLLLVLGNKETLPTYRRKQGTWAHFFNRGTKLYKLEDEDMYVIKRGTNSENMWEHGNVGQFWKRTREEGPPLGDPHGLDAFLSVEENSDVPRNVTFIFCCFLFSFWLRPVVVFWDQIRSQITERPNSKYNIGRPSWLRCFSQYRRK